jgi:hypothetical protein
MSVSTAKEKKKYPLGFKTTKNKKTNYKNGGFIVPIIEKLEIGGLLKKEATYTFVYQYKFFLLTRTIRN